MPARIRFVAAGAVAGGLIVLAAACGGGQPTPPPGLDEVQLAGWQAYVDLNCASCHGEHREGQRSGPELMGLAEHWTPDRMVSYLEDPDGMIKRDPRLAYKSEKYAVGMPGHSGKYPGYDEKARTEKLQALAQYLMVDVHWPGD